jgi:nitrous oxidase accessory protein NosD
LRIVNVAGFAILVSHAADIAIEGVMVRSAGGRNALGRNNATGGILLEEGSTDFRVTGCVLRDILGNGIWTHSLYPSPRNARGLIAGNRFDEIGRDAIQVGHALDIRVEGNEGARIGYPVEERTVYSGNRYEEIDGKCIDLDGFHDGAVSGNSCYNAGLPPDYPFGNYGIVMNNSNPDMQSRNIQVVDNVIDGPLYGGIFVIGQGHRIAGNQLLHLNTAHCGCVYDASQPDILAAGIYLGKGAERPAPSARVVVEDNFVSGYRMKTHCVETAPSIPPAASTVRNNRCEDR